MKKQQQAANKKKENKSVILKKNLYYYNIINQLIYKTMKKAKFTLSPNQLKNLENYGIYPETKSRGEKIGSIINNCITLIFSGVILYGVAVVFINLINKF